MRAGILELGISGGEATYRVSEAFAERLTRCHEILMAAGGYGKNPVGEVVLLATIDWFKPVTKEDAFRYSVVLENILRLEEG